MPTYKFQRFVKPVAWHSKQKGLGNNQKVGVHIAEVSRSDIENRYCKTLFCNCIKFEYGRPCDHVIAAYNVTRLESQADDDIVLNPMPLLLQSNPETWILLHLPVGMKRGITIPVRPNKVGGSLFSFDIMLSPTDHIPCMDMLSWDDFFSNLHELVASTLELYCRDPQIVCKSPAHVERDVIYHAERRLGWGDYHPRQVADWYLRLNDHICVDCFLDTPSDTDINALF